MKTRTYFDAQKENAQAAARFGWIADRTSANHVKSVIIPGHNGKQYFVILSYAQGEIVTDCNCKTSIGLQPCPGSYKGICYHAMAAIIKAASETKKNVSFCQTPKTADLVSKLGGKVYKITSRRNTEKHLWTVVK